MRDFVDRCPDNAMMILVTSDWTSYVLCNLQADQLYSACSKSSRHQGN